MATEFDLDVVVQSSGNCMSTNYSTFAMCSAVSCPNGPSCLLCEQRR
ncbi:FDLD family class I lanthipeptide [Nocardia sp. CA2R105]|nr:FDLD family class I lanthipeptide [Nocardia coffeae]